MDISRARGVHHSRMKTSLVPEMALLAFCVLQAYQQCGSRERDLLHWTGNHFLFARRGNHCRGVFLFGRRLTKNKKHLSIEQLPNTDESTSSRKNFVLQTWLVEFCFSCFLFFWHFLLRPAIKCVQSVPLLLRWDLYATSHTFLHVGHHRSVLKNERTWWIVGRQVCWMLFTYSLNWSPE